MFNLIVDENLRLRNIHPNDVEALFDLIEQNRARLRPWIDPYSLPETAKATRLFTIHCLFNFYGDPTGPSELDRYFLELESYFPPLVRPIDLGIWFQDKLAGSVMMSWPEHNASVLEFGYWISAKHEGNGIVTRCVSALMDYALDYRDAQKFIIGCAVNNRRSRAVPERLGCRLLVTQPKGEIVGDFVYDRVIYGIQGSAWRERNNRVGKSCDGN